jgi:hypothetical protein
MRGISCVVGLVLTVSNTCPHLFLSTATRRPFLGFGAHRLRRALQPQKKVLTLRIRKKVRHHIYRLIELCQPRIDTKREKQSATYFRFYSSVDIVLSRRVSIHCEAFVVIFEQKVRTTIGRACRTARRPLSILGTDHTSSRHTQVSPIPDPGG